MTEKTSSSNEIDDSKKKEFSLKLIDFYSDYITNSAQAVKKLADIEREYPEQYQIIRQAKFDPMSIDKIMENMTSEEKEIFFTLFMKSSLLGRKLVNLFDITADEKDDLAKELLDLSKEISDKLSARIEKL